MNKINAFAELRKPLDFLKIIAVYTLICIISILPAIAGFTGMFFEEAFTGHKVHEGNSIFGALPWLCLLTLPFGAVLFVVWSIIILKSNIAFYKKRKSGF